MMSKYARIEQGVVAETFETEGDIATMFHPSIAWVLCAGDITAGFIYDGTEFSPPVAVEADASVALKLDAQALLDKSDNTVLRCYEAGVSVPASWVEYRSRLRAIVSAGSGLIPTRPAYPAGT
jgi:hypothetical protein